VNLRDLPQRLQSRRASLAEAFTNTIVGYLLAYLATYVIVLGYGMQMSHGDVAAMVNWMTLLSVLRGYVLRRMWNAEFWNRWNWRHPFVLQPHPVMQQTTERITLGPEVLIGARPLTIEEQRELLRRLRELQCPKS
jgi:hypothetical protein